MTSNQLTFEKVIDAFGITDLKRSSKGWSGCCPIHSGDNKSAFIFYENSNIWRCFTHGCHEEWGQTIRGFIRGMLARDTGSASYKDVDEWIKEQDFEHEEYKPRFRIGHHETIKIKPLCEKERFLESVTIPSQYYIDRGFSKAVLRKFNVGDCHKKGVMMQDRALVPIFDKTNKWVVGCSGRSLNNHPLKWLHSKGFPRGHILYNQHFAQNEIKKTGIAILVEGPAKVWRLEEAGIFSSMATFGTQFTENQIKRLSETGAKKILIAMDGDEPGKKATQKIKEKIDKLFEVKVANWDILDIDESDVKEVSRKMRSILKTL